MLENYLLQTVKTVVAITSECFVLQNDIFYMIALFMYRDSCIRLIILEVFFSAYGQSFVECSSIILIKFINSASSYGTRPLKLQSMTQTCTMYIAAYQKWNHTVPKISHFRS